MKKGKQKKLSGRMTIYCLLFAGLLSIVIGGLGFYTYDTKSIQHYEKYIRSLLYIAADIVEADVLKSCMEKKHLNEDYEIIQERLNGIKENSELEYIYIIAPKEQGEYEYLMCGYNEMELNSGEELKKFGDLVTEWDIEADMLLNFSKVMKGENQEEFIPNDSGLGYVMTGIVPIIDEEGTIIAVIGVDIAMEDIISDLKNYVIIVLIGTCILTTTFAFIFLMTIKKTIVKPILALGKHADEFVMQTKGKPSEMIVTELRITTQDEIEQLSKQMNQMMKEMVDYMSDLESVTAVQERFSVQLNVAKQIQQSMIPSVFPAFPERTEFDIYGRMNPAKEVGGDFFDFFLIDGTHLGVVIADVSGEGVPAALFMMMTRTLVKNYAMLGLEPAKVFYEVNKELCENNDAGMTVEAFMGILDVYYGDFIYASAGAHTPLLRKAGEEFEEIVVKPGFLLGMLEKVSYQQETMKLNSGDILCLCTGGVSKITREDGQHFVLKNSINGVKKESNMLVEFVQQVNMEIENFLGESRSLREEDVTVMMVRFEGGR